MHAALPMIRLTKREARAALVMIDELQPAAPMELDWQDCILISLRGRLRDKRREVTAACWPELKDWLEKSPGLLQDMFPRREIAGSDAIELIRGLMAWHVFALFTPDVDPLWVLMAEGLLNALMVEPQTIAGADLFELVAMVQSDCLPLIQPTAA